MLGWLPNLLQAAQRVAPSLGEGNTLLVQWGVVLGASLAAAVWDLRVRRIPNGLTLPLLVSGLAWNTWVGGLAGLASGVGGCVIAALPFVVLYLYAGGGAGDAKLMMGVGAWLGALQGVGVLLAVVTAGAVLGLTQAALAKRFREVTGRVAQVARVWFGWISFGHVPPVTGPINETHSLQMPYGVSIFGGVLIAAIGTLLWNA